MSDATMRAAIKARLDALGSGIGRVHDYERWTVEADEFLSLFQDPTTKKVFGWEITRTGFSVDKAGMNKWRLAHKYVLRGYYAIDDSAATEKAVNALVDLIVTDLILTPIDGTQGGQLPSGKIGIRLFGDVLCHVPEITLPEVAEIVKPPADDGETDLEAVGLEYYLTPGDETADASDVVDLG